MKETKEKQGPISAMCWILNTMANCYVEGDTFEPIERNTFPTEPKKNKWVQTKVVKGQTMSHKKTLKEINCWGKRWQKKVRFGVSLSCSWDFRKSDLSWNVFSGFIWSPFIPNVFRFRIISNFSKCPLQVSSQLRFCK